MKKEEGRGQNSEGRLFGDRPRSNGSISRSSIMNSRRCAPASTGNSRLEGKTGTRTLQRRWDWNPRCGGTGGRGSRRKSSLSPFLVLVPFSCSVALSRFRNDVMGGDAALGRRRSTVNEPGCLQERPANTAPARRRRGPVHAQPAGANRGRAASRAPGISDRPARSG
jgi:hypothetical protein